MTGRIKKRPEDDIDQSQLVRQYPSEKALLNGQREFADKIAHDYTQFLSHSPVPWMATDEVIKRAKEQHGYVKDPDGKKPFYVTGPDEKSFALVRPGIEKKTKDPLEDGIRIIAAHTDSPGLILKQRPLFFEWSPDTKELSPGLLFDTYTYGGLQPYQWNNLQLKVHGTGVHQGRRWENSMDGVTIGHSAHLDNRTSETSMKEAFVNDRIKIFTGHRSRKEVLDFLGLKSEDDFFTTTWHAVPDFRPKQLNAHQMTKSKYKRGDWIAGYGHDDKACIYAAMQALFQSRKTVHPCIVLGLDYEEVGSTGSGSAQGKFIEKIINIVRKTSGSKMSLDEVIDKSIAISADVDITSGPHENVEVEQFDSRNIPRVGYGVSIYQPTGLESQNNTPMDFKYFIRQLAKNKGIPHQLVGTGHISDNAYGSETIGQFLGKKGLLAMDAGPAIYSSHGVAELLFAPDLVATMQLNRAFLESFYGYREIKKLRDNRRRKK